MSLQKLSKCKELFKELPVLDPVLGTGSTTVERSSVRDPEQSDMWALTSCTLFPWFHAFMQVFRVLLSKQHTGACVVQLSTWFFGIWSSLLCGCVGRIAAVMQNLGNRAAFLVVQCWSELQVHCTLLSSLTYLSIHTVHIALFSNPLPVFLSSFFHVKILLQASNFDN